MKDIPLPYQILDFLDAAAGLWQVWIFVGVVLLMVAAVVWLTDR
jgi:hypothetical protein